MVLSQSLIALRNESLQAQLTGQKSWHNQIMMRGGHTAQCLRSQQVKVTTLWRAAAMMMSELANSAELTQHGLFNVLVSALAMQLIILFCNLQQQPTCIKNIKSITCSGDPHQKYPIKV